MPPFADEAEEAEWWYESRSVHGRQLLIAVKRSEAKVLTNEKLRALQRSAHLGDRHQHGGLPAVTQR